MVITSGRIVSESQGPDSEWRDRAHHNRRNPERVILSRIRSIVSGVGVAAIAIVATRRWRVSTYIFYYK